MITRRERAFLYEKEDGVNGDQMQVNRYGDGIHVEIDEPWAGSTEAGFGATTSIDLPREAALELLAWLKEALETP